MSLTQLLNQRAELFQPVKTRDRLRTQTYQWPQTPVAAFPARLQLLDTTVDAPREGTPRRWQLYLTADASITTINDRFRIDGRWFDVVTVYPVQSPRLPGTHHIQAVVVEFDGEVPHAE